MHRSHAAALRAVQDHAPDLRLHRGDSGHGEDAAGRDPDRPAPDTGRRAAARAGEW